MQNSYFIKPGYQINEVPRTMDIVSNETYWSADRIQTAEYYQYSVYTYASKLIKKLGLKSVMDIGCGPAPKLKRLHNKNPKVAITGLDQAHPIAYCKKTYDFGSWLTDDFENPQLPQTLEKTDMVICADVIEHIVDPNKLLDYIKSVLKPDGYVVLSTPERDRTRGADCMNCPQKQHIREWNSVELKQYIESQGFEVVEHFCSRPYKLNFKKTFVKAEIKRILKGLPEKNNQVMLLRKA